MGKRALKIIVVEALLYNIIIFSLRRGGCDTGYSDNCVVKTKTYCTCVYTSKYIIIINSNKFLQLGKLLFGYTISCII